MTLPFNLVAVICFLTWQSGPHKEEAVEVTSNSTVEVTRLLEGAILSLGQVYAVPGLGPSLIMWAALTLYSPLLASLSALGALIGTCLPLLLLDRSDADLETVYTGLWGYSSILSLVCVSWAVFPFTPKSLFAGLVNTLATVATQKALMRSLAPVGLPVFTLPFTLSTLMLVLSWGKQGQRWEREDKPSQEEVGC